MLTAIRERATGWIAWVIVILITIPFALWGINSYFEGSSETAVAKVNGYDIPVYAYQQDLARQRQALTERLGGNFDPAILDTLGIKQRIIDGLVDNQLLNQFATEHNLRISDQQLKTLVQSFPSFQSDGKFDMNQYEAILRSNGFTPQSFEQSQRANEVINQLRIGMTESSFTTDYERDLLLKLQEQSRVAQYVVIDPAKFLNEIEASEDEIKDYYDRNKSRYETEARIKVDYIILSVDTLAESVQADDEDIATYYEEIKGRYKLAESRKASHILINVSQSADEEEKQAQLEKANEILEQALQGADFAELAIQHSDDSGSSQNGGDLGVVAKGQMVKPFEDAVFGMNEGDIEGPVETKFGYHIIKLMEVQEGKQKTLEQVKTEIEAEVKKTKAEALFAEYAESFQNLVFEDPDNITTAADEMDLPINTSDWFTQAQGTGVASDNVVRRAAFSEDVLAENLVSPAIEIGFDKLVAVQKSDYEPAAIKPLNLVKQEVTSAIRAEKSQAKVLQLGSDLLTELESMEPGKESWQQVIAKQGLESLVLPDKKSEIPAQINAVGDAVFAHSAPKEGTLNFGGLALDNDGYALYSLESVVAGDPSNADEAKVSVLESRLAARDGNAMYDQFISFLRDNAEIVVYEEQL